MRDRDRAGEVGDEDERAAQDRDEDEVTVAVVAGDLSSELANPACDVDPGQVDLADPRVGLYSVWLLRPYFWARRSKSRR